jgi:hypothetical protein
MDTATGKHLPEGHLHRHPDLYFIDIAVGELTNKPAPALEVDNAIYAGRIKGGHQLVDGVCKQFRLFIGEFIWLKLVFTLALNTDPHRLTDLIHLRRAAFLALYAVQG